MSTGAGIEPVPEPDDATEPWPQGISRNASMRISDVLGQLRGDFPSVSHSKLRFLEEQGLITPVRTPAGYRQYSAADVERLRFVLTEQRDSYLPLKVIKERLAAMDAGEPAPGPAPRLAPEPGTDLDTSEPARRRWTVESVAEATSVSTDFVRALVTSGALRTASGYLDAGAPDVVRLAVRLAEHGIEPRHLRTLRSAAERQVALIDQVVAPYRSQQTTLGRARAAELADDLGDLVSRLHTVWVQQGAAELR